MEGLFVCIFKYSSSVEDGDSILMFNKPLPCSVPKHRHECLMRCECGYHDGTLLERAVP
jgi:hypothetical protein